MAYLIDSNVLIQAKNEYYAFEVCPGFWDWLRHCHGAGTVFSIERVREEIEVRNDALAAWVAQCPAGFFLSIDPNTAARLPEVVSWVMQGDFQNSAKTDFLAKADPILVATALAHPEYAVVSHEVHIEGERRKVKIPTVCRALGVRCVRTFKMLADDRARFVLPGGE
jgi:hypothetical protein